LRITVLHHAARLAFRSKLDRDDARNLPLAQIKDRLFNRRMADISADRLDQAVHAGAGVLRVVLRQGPEVVRVLGGLSMHAARVLFVVEDNDAGLDRLAVLRLIGLA
jgi:hypothetical protein